MDRLDWMTPGTQRLDLSLAQVSHQRLGHLRAGAVARTEKQGKRHERALSLIAGSARSQFPNTYRSFLSYSLLFSQVGSANSLFEFVSSVYAVSMTGA